MTRSMRAGIMVLLGTLAYLHAGSPLIDAVSEGNSRSMLKALKAGEQVNQCDSSGWSPLMWAVYQRQLPIVELLLKNGADPNLQSSSWKKYIDRGSTALMMAAKEDQGEIMKALIKAGARQELKDSQGEDAQSLAWKKRHQGALLALGIKVAVTPALERMVAEIERGKDIDATDENGWTVLHWAAFEGDAQTVGDLLAKGAKPNIQATKAHKRSESGATPLIVAAQGGQSKVLEALLRGKADCHWKDAEGRTAEDYVIQDESWDCQDVLLDRSPLKKIYTKLALNLSCEDEKTTKKKAGDLSLIREQVLVSMQKTALMECVEACPPDVHPSSSTIQVNVQFSRLDLTPYTASPRCWLTFRFVDAASGALQREQKVVLTTNFWEGDSSFRSERLIEGLGAFIHDYTLLLCGKVQPLSADEPCLQPDLRSVGLDIGGEWDYRVTHQNLRLWAWIDVLPYCVPLRRKDFDLAYLQKQRVAVWPIMRLAFDTPTKLAAISTYGSEEKALSILSEKLSTRIIRLSSSESLSAEGVRKMLNGVSDRLWLQPKRILPGSDSLLLSNLQLTPDFETLAKQAGLKGIRYLAVPHLMQALRVVASKGGETTRSNLALSIIDLEKRQVVWNGSFTAIAKSTWQQARALQQNEETILSALEKAISEGE